MGRNEFDASHHCPEENGAVVSIAVLIGEIPICPRCHGVIFTAQVTSLNLDFEDGKNDQETTLDVIAGKILPDSDD